MKKIILTVSVLGVVLATSCKKKSDEQPSTQQNAPVSLGSSESKSIMGSSKDAMVNDVIALTKGQGVTQLTNMADVVLALNPAEPISLARIADGEEIDPKEMGVLLSKQAKLFQKIFVPHSVITSLNRIEDNNYYQFDQNLGEYTWDNANGKWIKTANTEKIIINFPSDSMKRTVNDAVFTLTNFAIKAITKTTGNTVTNDTLPTSIIADLKIKGVLVASISYTGAYSSDGTPTAMNGNLFLSPFTYAMSFTDNGSSVSGSSTLLRDADVVVGIESTINLKGTGDNRTATSLSGNLRYRDIKLAGSVFGLDSKEEDTTTAQVNSHFALSMQRTSDNAKIADVAFAERINISAKKEIYVRMTYTDGTTDDIVTYLKPASDELEKFIQDQSK